MAFDRSSLDPNSSGSSGLLSRGTYVRLAETQAQISTDGYFDSAYTVLERIGTLSVYASDGLAEYLVVPSGWPERTISLQLLAGDGGDGDVFLGEPIEFAGGLTAAQLQDVLTRADAVDLAAKLNSALLAAHNENRAVLLPAGNVRIDDTGWLTPEGVFGGHLLLRGQGRFITTINHSRNLTKPGLVMQRARDVHLSGFNMIGPNTWIETTIAANDLKYVNANYVAAGVRDSRWSPQCAICIDPGIGALPGDGGYPGFTYNQGGGAGGGSGRIVIDVPMDRSVVGLMHNPDTTVSTQGDDITIVRPHIINCKVAIAVGQAQARAITVQGGTIGWGRTGIDCNQYGQQSGNMPNCKGTQFGPLFEVVSWNPGVNPLSMEDCHFESCHRIGQGIGGTGVFAGTFKNCNLTLLVSASNPSPRAPAIWEGSGRVVYEGGSIVDSVVGRADAYNCTGITFVGTVFSMANRFRPFIGCQIDFNSPTALRGNCRVYDTSEIIYGDEEQRRFLLTSLPTVSGRISAHWSGERRRTINAIYEFIPGVLNNYVSSGATVSNWVYGATTVAFDVTNAEAFCVADILAATFVALGKSVTTQIGAGYKVTAKSAASGVGTITCVRLHTQDYYSGEDGTATSVRIYVPYWAPAQALTGDTHTNTTLDNVSPTTILKDGDFLTAAAGLVTGYRIVSGEGTASYALNKAATDTAATKPLYSGRMNTVGLTPAF